MARWSMIRIINSFYLAGQIFRWAWLQCLFVLVFRWVSGFEQLLCPLPLDLQFLCWACFCLFDFVLELVGFVFRFEDFLALCCDCVQHNVLCNESEFSTVCVIQTVGSPVTRQGLNCFFLCQHSWKQFLALCVYTNARLSCSLHKYLFVFYIHLSKFWDIPPWLK